MSRALLIVIVLWATIYLPGLGSLEIKGEEGRRILPAVSMLESGNLLVPQIGSEPYFRKPPLVNWLVAASFKISGARNEWTARLPSALCVLAVALAFICIAGASLGTNGSLVAAIVWLTNFGMIEKGRLIEIEALYVSLFGLAFICWMSWQQERKSPWLTWTVPWIFLGLGLLAKGPLHLFFFYAVAIAVLWREGELRELLHPAHFVGIVLMLGIFAVWAIPYLHATAGMHATENWAAQFSGRLRGDDFKFTSWLLNIPRGLAYFLPWLLLLPLVRPWRENRISVSLCWGMAIPFLALTLLPSGLPRYAMPALGPACWLFAMGKPRRDRLVFGIAAATALVMICYAIFAEPFLARREKVKNLAAEINAEIPPNEPLFAIDPDYQPLLFYIKRPLKYLSRVDELPGEAHFVLVQPAREEEAVEKLRARPLLRLTDYRGKTVVLLRAASH